jgi:hypothetical protein
MARWVEAARLMVRYRRGRPRLPAEALWLAAAIFAVGVLLEALFGVTTSPVLFALGAGAVVFGISVLLIAALEWAKRARSSRSRRA